MNKHFGDLRTTYLVGETISVQDLPVDTHVAFVRTSWGDVFEVSLGDGVATVEGLPVGTHSFEAHSKDGRLLGEEFVGVRERRGDDPIMGFVTSFDAPSRPLVLSWLRDLRCTAVQVYDWMETYSSPLASETRYHDPLGREIDRNELARLIEGIKQIGAVAQAYAPVCAADAVFANSHAQWLLYRNDGAPQSLGTLLEIMDPANREWQAHWVECYGRAIDELGFDGLHLDTYGYPRNALNSAGVPVSVERAYGDFVQAVRAARPDEVISFNQVNGVPRGFATPSPPTFRYVEVWPPNGGWHHLEGLLARSSGSASGTGSTLALYPPVWSGDRSDALRTCVISEAVVTMLGSSVLQWGDVDGVLRHPYYVDHEKLTAEERATVLAWHRMALRCRDLWRIGEDTTWYELSDENAAVTISGDAEVSPEPVGGQLFCRVRRDEGRTVVGLIDLTGSGDGSWHSGTATGTCVNAEVSVLVPSPENWSAQVATVEVDGGRFVELDADVTIRREGRALTCTVPLASGWSVLRLQRTHDSK